MKYIEIVNDNDIKNIKTQFANQIQKFNSIKTNMAKVSNNEIEMIKNSEHEEIYKILSQKNKRIFDLIHYEEIIVTYNQDQIELLCEILLDNNIKCKDGSFRTYCWVRFNDSAILEYANDGPMNPPCKVYKFDDFIATINI